METLFDRYARVCRGPNDISEHLPVLRDFASRCERIVEFGVRGGNSTTALLYGLYDHLAYSSGCRPHSLRSFDLNDCPEAAKLERAGDDVDFTFSIADSRKTPPLACDLLFIDTLHTEAQLAAELSRHAGGVRRWILLHDTKTFGDVGEDGGPGLWPAIVSFIANADARWRIAERLTNQNGLTVLERLRPPASETA